MASRFGPGVLPRQRPGLFGVLASAVEGGANFVEARDFKRRRDVEDERATAQFDAAQDAAERARLRDEFEFAARGFLPAGEDDEFGDFRQAIGPTAPSDRRVQTVDDPGFRPDAHQMRDRRILEENGGFQPGDIRPPMGIRSERLAPDRRIRLRSGGSILNPAFADFQDEQELMRALEGQGLSPDQSLLVRNRFLDLDDLIGAEDEPDEPTSVEELVTRAALSGDPAELEAALSVARQYRRSGFPPSQPSDSEGSRNARFSAEARAVRLMREQPGLSPEDAADRVFDETGIRVDANRVGDVVRDRSADERRRFEQRLDEQLQRFQGSEDAVIQILRSARDPATGQPIDRAEADELEARARAHFARGNRRAQTEDALFKVLGDLTGGVP
jgi:hypothetical protein